MVCGLKGREPATGSCTTRSAAPQAKGRVRSQARSLRLGTDVDEHDVDVGGAKVGVTAKSAVECQHRRAGDVVDRATSSAAASSAGGDVA